MNNDIPDILARLIAVELALLQLTEEIRRKKLAKEWLTVAEAAHLIDVDQVTIRRAIKRSLLKASDVSLGDGRPKWRIRRKDFEKWLKSRAPG